MLSWRHTTAPGDLLTTSEPPGHALKASDRERSHGALIGKAMTGLSAGRGLVLVLVNLQQRRAWVARHALGHVELCHVQ
jgi:hypothetical protein